MQCKEEKKLSELRANYDDISIPNNIDEYIVRGIKKYPKSRIIGLSLRPLSIAAVIALFLLLSMIRMSPVFAEYLEDVPILKYIVKLVHYDKGLKSAVENNFIQNIAISDEHENIKLIIDNIIIDQARMIVFYTIENNSSYKYLDLSTVKFADITGKNLEAAYSYSSYFDHDDQRTIQDNIKVSFVENSVIPDTIHFELELQHKDHPDSMKAVKLPYLWQVDIPIDKSKFENLKEIYDINQTVEIENQKICFKKAVVYPTRIEVQVEFPEENSKKILRFDNLRILNEKGEALTTITNDVNATMPDENHVNLYFESNFFSLPQKLYLQGSSIRALDKDRLELVIDTEREQLLKAPDDNIILHDITQTAEGTDISFLLNTDEVLDDKFSYFIFTSRITDINGVEYVGIRASSSEASNPAFNQEIIVTIPKNSKYADPISLTIEDYPARINGDFKIRIK
jgi:hypothetical protein